MPRDVDNPSNSRDRKANPLTVLHGLRVSLGHRYLHSMILKFPGKNSAEVYFLQNEVVSRPVAAVAVCGVAEATSDALLLPHRDYIRRSPR